jgi:hypothetical protein
MSGEYLDDAYVYAEVIRLLQDLSIWTKNPMFYIQLLCKTVTLHKGGTELASFLMGRVVNMEGLLGGGDENDGNGCEKVWFLHLIARQFDPMVAVAEKVLRMFPTAASVQDERGETPLHVAVSQGFPPSMDLVRLLLAYCPRAAEMKSSSGKLPIHLLCCHSELPSVECLEVLLKVCIEKHRSIETQSW